MKLWLISQSVSQGYDTYDSAVVAARTEEEAKNIHPSHGGPLKRESWGDTWATRTEDVTAKLIGTAVKGTRTGVICASFNAG